MAEAVHGLAALVGTFERLIRILYPGVLLWALLPLSFGTVGQWQKFYHIGSFAQAGLIVASGLFLYVVERYLIHEPFLAFVLHRMGIGAALAHRNKCDMYPMCNGRFMFVRFGWRPFDGDDRGERAEDRFANYMAARMAWVHALGSTWQIGIILGGISIAVPYSSFAGFPPPAWVLYWLAIAVLMVAWAWHAAICARAEQFHYGRGGPTPPGIATPFRPDASGWQAVGREPSPPFSWIVALWGAFLKRPRLVGTPWQKGLDGVVLLFLFGLITWSVTDPTVYWWPKKPLFPLHLWAFRALGILALLATLPMVLGIVAPAIEKKTRSAYRKFWGHPVSLGVYWIVFMGGWLSAVKEIKSVGLAQVAFVLGFLVFLLIPIAYFRSLFQRIRGRAAGPSLRGHVDRGTAGR